MPATDKEKRRVRDLVSAMYSDGYSDGLARVASRWPDEMAPHVPEAARRMGGKVSVRLDLVDKAIDSYIESVERKAVGLRAAGISGTRLFEEVTRYAEHLATNKGELIAQMEWAKGRLDGAGTLVDESGEKFEWRFPHFETADPEHEECAICEAIRERAPYSTEDAEGEGYPDLPHPNCDHGWVLVPKEELTRTEEHPQGPALERAADSGALEKHYEDGSCTPGEADQPGCEGNMGGPRGSASEQTDASLKRLQVGERVSLPPMTVSRGTPYESVRTGLVAELERESASTGNRTYRVYDATGGLVQRVNHKNLMKPYRA
jgi:hypothetical protein